jgi:hypothetical protein
MTRAKKAKVTAIDRIAERLRVALRGQTKSIIEIGKLLIESQKHLEHGEWQDWLVENFDLSYRTARRYVVAAEYAAKSDTVSHLTNLAPSVLYNLAEGEYSEQEEAAILAAARKGRVDVDAAAWICEKLKPPKMLPPPNVDADDQENGDEDAESKAILDGPPPAVPPTADPPPPTNFALADFDKAIDTLDRLRTKPAAQFAETTHDFEVLLGVEAFLHAVKILRQREQQK